MKKLFGTDGIRGRANLYPITAEMALSLGKAIAQVFNARGLGEKKAIIGKDTRLSGYMLEAALNSGLLSKGMNSIGVGPMPTPALAHLTKSFNASCGIMITASHNPAQDNGIKIFDHEGFKLPDEVESQIESLVLNPEKQGASSQPDPIGKAYRIDDARGRYIEFAKASVRNHSLKGIKIVLDCANGAAYSLAPLIFQELGAEVITSAIKPDGLNINDNCGATHPEAIKKLLLQQRADIGVSLDGDADRVIFLDAQGRVVNGDRILALCALDLHRQKRLEKNTLVLTCMSNLGLHKSMREAGINTVTTEVGDKHVIENMRQNGYNLGGEPSGHIVFMDYVTTGDGIISALHVIRQMLQRGKSLAELADCMQEYPQCLQSITVKEKVPLSQLPLLERELRLCQDCLANSGRVLLRYSGTEQKVRLLLEAENAAQVEHWRDRLLDCIQRELCS
ncbi:MAG: phosphoglucosamine mutase [Lentisphaeria bacterium]|jgi:phosphoglucosamine mutase|nr:phosphoglucosamine mutase [Lentisphaeria bacterium]MDY0177063.1 phosphoglucosamine mutase [Lentisphaeria bacterium]NLZ60005.1 phosphoglucosamine mutase [Lentisphaerota bacterium]